MIFQEKKMMDKGLGWHRTRMCLFRCCLRKRKTVDAWLTLVDGEVDVCGGDVFSVMTETRAS